MALKKVVFALDLVPLEFQNQRILTTELLALEYGTEPKVISNNFNRNKERYQEGKHFYGLDGEELKNFITIHQFDERFKHSTKLYLWTERGALLHAKSLNTDRAWEVYEKLVDNYFSTHNTTALQLESELVNRVQFLEQQFEMITQYATEEQEEGTRFYMKNTSSIEFFIKQCMRPCRGNIINLNDAYSIYIKWCSSWGNNFKPMYKISLESALRSRYLLKKQKGLGYVIVDFEFAEFSL